MRVIGREDEFRLENRIEGKRYDHGIMFSNMKRILEEADIELKDSKILKSDGRFERLHGGFEVTTPTVELKKGCFEKLTLSTLAHRMILLYAFREYERRNGEEVLIYGWSSHDSVSLNYRGYDEDDLYNVVSNVIRATIGPVLVALYKAKISCYSVGVTDASSGKEDTKLRRLEFCTEYIPDHIQLSAANAFLASSVTKLEKLVKKYIRENLGIKGENIGYDTNEFGEFYRQFGFSVNCQSGSDSPLWLYDDFTKILEKGLKAKIPIIDKKSRKREITLGYLFRYWLDFFMDDIGKYATEREIETLDALSKGKRKLILEYNWPPYHYDICESYFRTFTRQDPVEFFKKHARIGMKGWC